MNLKIQILSKFFNKKYTSQISSTVEVFDSNKRIYFGFVYVNDEHQHCGCYFFTRK